MVATRDDPRLGQGRLSRSKKIQGLGQALGPRPWGSSPWALGEHCVVHPPDPISTSYLTPRYLWVSPYQSDLPQCLQKVLCLSQVSPYWRQIVHNTPQLWAEGVVDIRLRSKEEMTNPYLDGLKTLLARSSPFPISVSVAQDVSSDFTIVGSIVPTAQRWKNLHLDIDALDYFNGMPPGTFAALEKLYINDCSLQTSAVTAFQSAPRLRSFSIKMSKIHLSQLPWCQLTHLDVEGDSLGPCRTVLLQCSNLISARFYTRIEWDLTPEATDSPVIVLPFVATLTMILHGFDSGQVHGLEAFFTPLSLPSLTTIDLEFDRGAEEVWPTEVFSEFQTRAPKIREIALWFSSIGSDALIALLRHGPSLTTLRIQNSWQCVEDDFFNALRYDDSASAPVAPKLQNIHLECVGEFNERPFEDAIRSRWWKDGARVLIDGSPPRVGVPPQKGLGRSHKYCQWHDER
ncbi:hypothetical protein B0H19DRAFT_1190828 [Mycena capillaripes]|nr:hypothetical protein B0H19DRAFT_1190828 [Mycena capillaripes]